MTEWRLTDRTSLISKIQNVWSDRFSKNAVACKGYTSVLSKMVSVKFAVLEVSFWALTTVVWTSMEVFNINFCCFITIFCCTMLCKRGVSRHPSVCPCVCHVQQIININMKTLKLEIFTLFISVSFGDMRGSQKSGSSWFSQTPSSGQIFILGASTGECLQVCQISNS